MTLTDEEIRSRWQRNQIEPETITYIQRVRSSEPERKVRGGASNVSGRYPSQKMGFSIQFESQHVELRGCYTMERDNTVLEMYDQPTRIHLHYHARSGRKTSPCHTPDFLVVRRDGAGFEEWKKASSLEKLVETMPGRYQRQASGRWRCPPGEQAAAPRNEVLRFPSHDKRKTCTPNTEQQWVMEQATWEVVGGEST